MQALEEGAGSSAAAAAALRAMDWVGSEAGTIVLDSRGRPGCAHNSANFAIGAASSVRPQPAAWLHQDAFYEAMGHE
jgi:isoaspartyl peptidase/L-asparaginase-like protein (Ntn-hydrolase superfamily)